MAEKRPKSGLGGSRDRDKAKAESRKRQLKPDVILGGVDDVDDDEAFVPEPKVTKKGHLRVELSGPVAKTKTLGLRRPRLARNCFILDLFS